MNDPISRQAAIDALGEREELDDAWTDEYEVGRFQQWKDDVEALKKLPAAQTCDDAVSRRAVIETAENVAYAVDEHGSADGWLAMLVNSLEILPSAQPDSLVRPSARWMNVGHKRARICSSCFRDEPYKFADNDADVYDFCPHCGARMEVSE